MRRSVSRVALRVAASAAALLACAYAQCDQEYECEFRTPGQFSIWYDLKPLCKAGEPYVITNSKNETYSFMVCGTANVDCLPPYPHIYQRGAAVQFFGDVPATGTMCTNNLNQTVPCTRDCEVLGVGPPSISLLQPTNPYMGVSLTYYSVPDHPEDPFQCDIDPTTNERLRRQVTINVTCNHQAAMRPILVSAGESGPCQYTIVLQSKYGCGCEPYCTGRNCGSNGCGGYCGAIGMLGSCPMNSTCTAYGTCCVPDCRGRQCGDNGCGGTCGTCAGNEICTRYQTCADAAQAASPLPSMLPAATVYTTPASDKAAAYFGGILGTAAVAVLVYYVLRVRTALRG